ncbi:MAG: HEPN domain-containing protein [Proteobacteria bacterium]|nr:HEPN domain-containing protein [Pseudomonadota bacterium]
MTPEAGHYLHKAHQCLAHARAIVALPIADVAGKEAYLAGYHAAEAFIFEHNGKPVRTHKGVRLEFARLSQNEPKLREFVAFLARAYELKSVADYGVGPDVEVTLDDATAAIATAERLVGCIAALLGAAAPYPLAGERPGA